MESVKVLDHGYLKYIDHCGSDASANLKNWLDFMTLRSDAVESGRKAQWEISQYANAVGKIIAELFPRTWELFIGVGK